MDIVKYTRDNAFQRIKSWYIHEKSVKLTDEDIEMPPSSLRLFHPPTFVVLTYWLSLVPSSLLYFILTFHELPRAVFQESHQFCKSVNQRMLEY